METKSAEVPGKNFFKHGQYLPRPRVFRVPNHYIPWVVFFLVIYNTQYYCRTSSRHLFCLYLLRYNTRKVTPTIFNEGQKVGSILVVRFVSLVICLSVFSLRSFTLPSKPRRRSRAITFSYFPTHTVDLYSELHFSSLRNWKCQY